MSTRIKRTIPVVLAAILLATVCLLFTSQRAYAENFYFEVDGIEYDHIDTTTAGSAFNPQNTDTLIEWSGYTGAATRGVQVYGYTGDGGDVVIPRTVSPAYGPYAGETFVVTRITAEAFFDEGDNPGIPNITSIQLPDTIVQIGDSAFSGTRISEITIPVHVDQIDDEAFFGCKHLNTVRVLSAREGDYYGEACIGFYWDDNSNKIVKNTDLVVWGVKTDPMSGIEDYCEDEGLTFRGFPPTNPRWNGNVAEWNPPAYRADAVQYYRINIYKDGKPLPNAYTTDVLSDPTACSCDFSKTFKAFGRGKYKFYVTAACASNTHSYISEWSPEYAYNGPVSSYTLTFSPEGGSGSMNPITVDAGVPVTMPKCTFTPPSPDKNFKCWKIRDQEYGIGQVIQLRGDDTAKAQWKDKSEPDWTYSIDVPDVIVDEAHAGYSVRKVGSIRIYNTGNQRIQGDITVTLSDDTADVFTLYDGKPSVVSVGGYNHDCWVYAKEKLAPGTYTCKVNVTPPPPAEPVTANVSFTVTDHTWGNTWQSDATNHWKKCTQCAARTEMAPHDTNGGTTGASPATFDTDGYTGDKYCSACGAMSEQGEGIPAGKWILESGAISNPTYLKAGMSYGQMTLAPAHQGKYTVSISNAWDVTGGGRLIDANKIRSDEPFEVGHDYTLQLHFEAIGDYQYYTNGDKQYRWSSFTFNDASTRTGVTFPSSPIRNIDLHCFGSYKPSISNTEITIPDQTYTGDPIKPAPTVTYTDSNDVTHVLNRGVDYYVSEYTNNTEIGQATITIKPKNGGAFSGYSKTGSFNIVPIEVDYPDIEIIDDRVYDGSSFRPDPYVKVNGKTLVKDVDYTLTYKNSKGTIVSAATNVDWYEVDVNFIGHYTRSNYYSIYFAITPSSIASALINGVADKGFTGKALTQSFTVQVAGRVLTAGTDFTVTYANNTNPGTATYTISGTGNYNGSIGGSFQINQIWYRIWGATAPITMLEIAKEFGSSNYAFVTTDASYKDALAASALAGKYNGLVLMTKKGSLTPQTKQALQAAGVKTVYIVGSTSDVTNATQSAIKKVPGVKNVWRIPGASASAKAINVAKKVGKVSDTVIITTQSDYRDALAIAPYSYVSKSPILYAESNKKLSTATVNYIKTAKYKKAIVVGGPLALPSSVDTQLKKAGVTQITRLAGLNAYATSEQIAKWTTGKLSNGNYGTYKGKTLAYIKFQPAAANKLQNNKLAVSTGQNWLDALAGAALCGKNKSVLMLADAKTAKSKYTIATAYCKANKSAIKKAYVFGGPSAVQEKVWDALLASTE